jgi:hypothetical protein
VGIVVLALSILWISHNRYQPDTFAAPDSAGSPTGPLAPQVTTTPELQLVTGDNGPANQTTAGRAPLSQATPAQAPSAPTAPSIPAAAVPTNQPAVAATPAPQVAAGAPIQLTIPQLGVDSAVDEVLSDGRILHPPDDPLRVGWWIGSSLAGSDQGSTVLVGHVDSAAAGPGALFRLSELEAGAEIKLQTATGGSVRYAVTALADYAKTGDLPADLFRPSGPPQLILITCGGEFDAATESYADNIVVIAAPTA